MPCSTVPGLLCTTVLIGLIGGCTADSASKATPPTEKAAIRTDAANSTPVATNPPRVAEERAGAKKPAPLLPSWWTRPAPSIEGKITHIAQADAVDASSAKRAALVAGTAKLQAMGADPDRVEVLESTVTKVRFDGPFRAFVLVAAPKPK